MADCLFCTMSTGEIPVERVAENDHAFAIRDINPRAPVHVLVLPKQHIPTAKGLGPHYSDTLSAMFALANEAARIERVDGSGYRLAFNVGDDAGMSFEHLHLHVVGGRRLGPEG